LHKPEAINAYADATAFVPELHRLSMRKETLGRIPNISEIMVELYWSDAQLEKKRASISFGEIPLSLIKRKAGSQANSNRDIADPFVKAEVAHEEIATLRILESR
jgi:hypothetical protein